MTLSPRFDQALHYAALVHAGQLRRGTGVPYLAHLLGVTSIALEYGADEDEAIGALLHDAVEDAGGPGRLVDIRQRFGPVVAGIVAGCTDSDATPKPPWRQRKDQYIAHLATADAGTRLVSAADKLYNVRAILHHYRVHGEAVWQKFAGGRDGTLWYYRAVTNAFRQAGMTDLVAELDRAVTELEMLVAARSANLV
jgi:(p)ppGpp synthase/HD superfamily hydrolase